MQFLTELKYLFIRGLKQSTRPTAALIPSLVMPVFFLVVFSASLSKVAALPGFPVSSYLVFYAPVAILQAVFFSSGDAGIDMVLDISTGYFDKLLITPIHHVAIIVGKLLAVALRSAVQAGMVVIVFLLMGGKIVTGVPGLLVILALSGLFGMAWSGIGMTIALVTKNQRTTQSAFILFFPFTFITTSQLPLSQLSGWYKWGAILNPVTYVLEAFRSLTSTGWNWHVIGWGFATAGLVGLVTISTATRAFNRIAR